MPIVLREKESEQNVFVASASSGISGGKFLGYPEPDLLLEVHTIILTCHIGLSLYKSLFTLLVLVSELQLFQNHTIS